MKLRLRVDLRGNRRLRVLLVAALAAALGSLVFADVYLPYRHKTADLQRQVADLRSRVEQLRRQAAGVDRDRRELAEVRARLQVLAATFPPRLEQPLHLEFWEPAAAAAGLTLTGLTASAPEAVESYSRHRIEIRASGPYASHVQFALALQGMPWLFRLDSVSLTGGDAGERGATAGAARSPQAPGTPPPAPQPPPSGQPSGTAGPQAPEGSQPPAGTPDAVTLPPGERLPAGAARADGFPMPGAVQAVYRISLYVDAPVPQAGKAGGSQGGTAGGTQGGTAGGTQASPGATGQR